MCFSLVFACLSVSPSVGRISEALPCYTDLPHPGNRTWNRYGPQFWWEPAGRVRASTLAPEACVCARKCAGMYTGDLCASMYKGQGHITEAGRAA